MASLSKHRHRRTSKNGLWLFMQCGLWLPAETAKGRISNSREDTTCQRCLRDIAKRAKEMGGWQDG